MRWFMLIIGIALCGAGSMLLRIELLKQPAYTIDEQLNLGTTFDQSDLTKVIEQEKIFSSWGWKDAVLLKIVSLLEYAMATSDEASTDPALLQSSLAHLSEGLAMAPADPFGWLRFAKLRVDTAASPEDVGQALHMAVITGPVVTQLIIPRLKIALLYWDHLSQEDKQLYMNQIGMLKKRNPDEAANLALLNERNQKLFFTPGY